jgi:hypothetical protein
MLGLAPQPEAHKAPIRQRLFGICRSGVGLQPLGNASRARLGALPLSGLALQPVGLATAQLRIPTRDQRGSQRQDEAE